MPDDDLDASALMIAIDLVEQGGMPEQAEALRGLVRAEAWPSEGWRDLTYFAALHHSRPEGSQASRESRYAGYRRVAIPPGGWVVSAGIAVPEGRIVFPVGAPGPPGSEAGAVASYLSIGAMSEGPGRLLMVIPLRASISCGPHMTPSVQAEVGVDHAR